MATALEGVGVSWYVVGGWSIDLFLGEQTRAHEDLEIAVLRRDHPAVRAHLAPLELRSVGDGEIDPDHAWLRKISEHSAP